MDIDEYDSPEQIAQIVRAKWRLPMGPVQNMVQSIEAAGIIVISRFGTRKLDALSHWMPNQRPLFFVNDAVSGDRQRFSLAHEVGHVIMHHVRLGDPEDEADAFASEFLMPAREIKPQLRNLTMAKLGNLKYYWKVSMQALIRRARDLGQINERQYRRFMMQMSKRGHRIKEPHPIPSEEPAMVKNVIDVYRKHHRYTLSDLGSLTNLHAHEFGHLYLEDEHYLRRVK